jgi:hypothetical protein
MLGDHLTASPQHHRGQILFATRKMVIEGPGHHAALVQDLLDRRVRVALPPEQPAAGPQQSLTRVGLIGQGLLLAVDGLSLERSF